MCMRRRKCLNSAEPETGRIFRNNENGYCSNWKFKQLKKQWWYVHDSDYHLTVQILEDTSAVPSLGKLCGDQGFLCWSVAQNTFSKRQEMRCNTENKVYAGVWTPMTLCVCSLNSWCRLHEQGTFFEEDKQRMIWRDHHW